MVTANPEIIEQVSSGNRGFDFSSTFYGSMNPLMCDTKCIDFLNEFKDPDAQKQEAAEKSAKTVETLVSKYNFFIKNGSIKEAKLAYDKLIDEIIKASGKSNQTGSIKLRAEAKKILEEQLGIDFEYELEKYSKENKNMNYTSKFIKGKTDKKSGMQKPKITNSGIFPNAPEKDASQENKPAGLWDKAASVFGRPVFVLIGIAAVWAAYMFCQLQD